MCGNPFKAMKQIMPQPVAVQPVAVQALPQQSMQPVTDVITAGRKRRRSGSSFNGTLLTGAGGAASYGSSLAKPTLLGQ